ncbi:MAG TPA: GLUG motif-containing protein, partial [Pseudomonadales bacterium]
MLSIATAWAVGAVPYAAAYYDVTIGTTDTAGYWNGNEWIPGGTGSVVSASTIQALLASGAVTISTGTGSDGGTEDGNITVSNALSWDANTLTLTAANNININAVMTASGSAGLALNPHSAGGTGTVNVALAANGFTGRVDFTGAGNSMSINGTVYTIITSLGVQGSTTGTDLQGMNGDLTGHYVLGANVDASATAGWDSGAGLVPIGNDTALFTGTFDGLGHTITGLVINRSDTDYVGLFGYLSGATIRNIGMVDGTVSGHDYVGILAGGSDPFFDGFTLSNAYATGDVSGNQYLGGLVGVNAGAINNTYARATVTGGASSYAVGGLAGRAAMINDAYATGNVTGSGAVGGLAGLAITTGNAYATGNVSGMGGADGVGGLIGIAGTVSNAYATGNVTSSNWSTGGLVGYCTSGTISNAYATGDVSGTNNVGGLVGTSTSTMAISNVYATGSVSGTSGVGGLAGDIAGSIINGYWNTTTGIATGVGIPNGGSLTGGGLTTAELAAALPTGFSASDWGNLDNQSTPYLLANAGFDTVSGRVILGADGGATPSYYDVVLDLAQLQNINTTGLDGNYVLGANLDASGTGSWNSGAGFVPIGDSTTAFTGSFEGLNHIISNLTINRPAESYVGLFGCVNGGSLRNIGLAGGNVSGNSIVGALVGISFSGAINNAFASVNVSGTSAVGGLAGANASGSISNGYATGSVSGTSYVGGLVGENIGTISKAYATGSVSGSNNTGGLAGNNLGGVVSYGYWDKEATGQASSAGSADSYGLTTEQMQQQASFTGFDFSAVWVIYEAYTAPLLQSFEGNTDSDGDGYFNSEDDLPFDASEWLDTDGDGIGNNADSDDDNDGVADNEDAFPLDDSEWLDTDGDGIGNNADSDDD